jgi:hypothetical protein
MRERYNFESVRQANEYDVVRKAMNRHLTNVRVVYARHAASDLGKSLDQLQRATRFSDETFGDAWIAVAIPSCRLLVLDLRGLDDMK